MAAKSAGILVYRKITETFEVFLVHPGGPYFKNKDIHVWSIPKGEFDGTEHAFDAAIREFKEETGFSIDGTFMELTPARQASGKWVYAWAVEGDVDAGKVESNTIELEWPPKTGKYIEIPEVDKGGWFTLEEAKEKVFRGQVPLIEELQHILQDS